MATAVHRTRRRTVIAVLAALYLYFLLPATATLFYELYHLTQIGPVYWGYSAFKAAAYYFGIWEYKLPACLAVAAVIVLVPMIIQRLRSGRRQA